MGNDAFPLDAYLERIGYAGALTADEDVLESVQRAQLNRIPFENFDIVLGRGVSLEPAALVDKLIDRPRGGYCFELNGLLHLALLSVGFEARALLARVHMSGQPTGRTHELILVTIGDRHWIADAGFGGPSLRAPVPLELGTQWRQEGEHFRLVDAGPFGTMLQKQSEGEWRDLYSFGMEHVCEADIAVGHHFTSTSPLSRFTHTPVAALHTPTGKTTLHDRELRRIENGARTSLELPGGPAYLAAIEKYFGIEIDAPDATRLIAGAPRERRQPNCV